ncbi:MAG: ComF family protein [Treponemataceae bacterium]
MRFDILTDRVRDMFFPSPCACCGEPLEASEIRLGVCIACASLLRPEVGPRCVFCGRPLVSERVSCIECRECENPFYDEAHVLFRYGGLPRKFLVSYKFGAGKVAAAFIARLFAETIADKSAEIGCGFTIVPVPPRPGKLKKTGWDQVSAILDHLEKREGLPIRRCLVRLPSHTQKKLDKTARALNMRGVIRCDQAAPSRVVLIDDVLTTGATLNACALALRNAGCEYVFALAFCYD